MWSKINKLTLLSQSLFGLPWILMAVAFAYHDPKILIPSHFLFWAAFFTAFLTARILGMSLNRMIDFEIDGKNPRTKNRPLQIKIISRNEVKILIVCCTVLFVACCYYLNPLCFFLSPFVLFLLYAYSFTKRISALCHFFLGAIHFFGPIFAWIALTNSLDIRPVLLGAALWLLIAANDMVYAIQDLVFDRQEGLRSVPALLGERKTLLVAKMCHACAFLILISVGLIAHMNELYFVGVGLLIMTYIYYYREKFGPEMSFQQSNLIGGLILLTFTFLAVL
jgi:4-hydroxybenzoate polyprenyltransferase